MHSVKLIYNGSEWELEWFGRHPYDADAFADRLIENGQDYLASLVTGMAERNPPGALTLMKLLTDGQYVTPMVETLEFEGRVRSIVQYRPRPTERTSQGTVACGRLIPDGDVLLTHSHGRIQRLQKSDELHRAGSVFNRIEHKDLLLELTIPPTHSLLQALFVEAPRLRVGGGAGIDTRPISIQQLLDLKLAIHN